MEDQGDANTRVGRAFRGYVCVCMTEKCREKEGDEGGRGEAKGRAAVSGTQHACNCFSRLDLQIIASIRSFPPGP